MTLRAAAAIAATRARGPSAGQNGTAHPLAHRIGEYLLGARFDPRDDYPCGIGSEALRQGDASAMRVSMGPGYTPKTCVPCAFSMARPPAWTECVAALEALVGQQQWKIDQRGDRPDVDDGAAGRLRASTGAKACITAKVPKKFTSISWRQR